jgi:hypothetical protein
MQQSSMKAIKEQVDEKLMVIKLFVNNYARDLICCTTQVRNYYRS